MVGKATIQLTDDGPKLSAPADVDLQPIAKALRTIKPVIDMALELSPTRSAEVLGIRRVTDAAPDLGPCRSHNGARPATPGSLSPEEEQLLQKIRDAGPNGTSWGMVGLATEQHKLAWSSLALRGLIRSRRIDGRYMVVAVDGQPHATIGQVRAL